MSTNRNNQSGLVSLVVVMTLVIVLGLITTSFALLSRREQRRALDRQLSTQAFYAAESGVNAAIGQIDTITTNIDDCQSGNSITGSGEVSIGDKLSYTCVLVNKSPSTLEYSDVSTEESTIVKVKAASTIGKIRISWHASDQTGTAGFSSSGTFALPQAGASSNDPSSWKAGALRATLIPIPTFGSLTRTNLNSQSTNFFLYPNTNGTPNQVGPVSFLTTQSQIDGSLVNGQCNTGSLPRFCNVELQFLNFTSIFGATNTFYLRLTSLYKNSNVVITAYDGSGTQVNLEGTQAVIDSTGKANDVLRRIQVRVPLADTYYYPEFGVETTGNICKLLDVWPAPYNEVVDNCATLNKY